METSTSVDPKDFPWEFRPGAVRTKTSFPAPLGTAGAGAGTAGAADGRLGKAGPGLTAFYGFLRDAHGFLREIYGFWTGWQNQISGKPGFGAISLFLLQRLGSKTRFRTHIATFSRIWRYMVYLLIIINVGYRLVQGGPPLP